MAKHPHPGQASRTGRLGASRCILRLPALTAPALRQRPRLLPGIATTKIWTRPAPSRTLPPLFSSEQALPARYASPCDSQGPRTARRCAMTLARSASDSTPRLPTTPLPLTLAAQLRLLGPPRRPRGSSQRSAFQNTPAMNLGVLVGRLPSAAAASTQFSSDLSTPARRREAALKMSNFIPWRCSYYPARLEYVPRTPPLRASPVWTPPAATPSSGTSLHAFNFVLSAGVSLSAGRTTARPTAHPSTRSLPRSTTDTLEWRTLAWRGASSPPRSATRASTIHSIPPNRRSPPAARLQSLPPSHRL